MLHFWISYKGQVDIQSRIPNVAIECREIRIRQRPRAGAMTPPKGGLRHMNDSIFRVSAFAEAHRAGLWLVPRLSGGAHVAGSMLYYNATFPADVQQEMISNVLEQRARTSGVFDAASSSDVHVRRRRR